MTASRSAIVTPAASPALAPQLSPECVAELRRTWALVAPAADEFAQLFYDRLFELDPSLRVLFRDAPRDAQRQKLMQSLAFIVERADRLSEVAPLLASLGARHVRYGVIAAHYAVVGEALLWTLDSGLGVTRSDASREAWEAAYGVVAEMMGVRELAKSGGTALEATNETQHQSSLKS